MSYWQRGLVVVGVSLGLVALAVAAFVSGASHPVEALDVTERSEPTP